MKISQISFEPGRILESVGTIRARWVFSWLLFGISCLTMAQAILAMTAAPSLGSLGRVIVLPMVFVCLTGLNQAIGLGHLGLPDLRISDWRIVAVVMVMALPFAYGVLGLSQVGEGMTGHLVALATITAAALTLFLSATRDDSWALVALLAVSPFWSFFLKWDMRLFFWPVIVVTACRLIAQRKRIGRTPFDISFLSFFAIMLISSLVSRDPETSLSGLGTHILTPLLWFFLVVAQVQRRRDMIRVIGAAALSATVLLAMKSYFQVQVSGWEVEMDLYGRTANYITGNIGSVATTAGLAVPLALGSLMLERKPLGKIAWGGALVLLFYLILASHVRAITLALLALTPMFLFHNRRTRLCYSGSVSVVAVFVFFVPELRDLVFSRFQVWSSLASVQADQAMRLDAWQAAIRMMLDHPWLGIGLEMWPTYDPLYSHTYILSQAHNVPLNYGSAGGIGALLAFLFIVGVAVRSGLHCWRGVDDPGLRTVAFAAFGAIIVDLVNGSIGGAWYLSPNSWMMMGILVAVERLSHLERVASAAV